MSTITQFPSGNTQYRIEFDYLARPFVVVTLVNSSNPTLNRVLEVGRDYRFLNPTVIEILVDQSGFDIVRIHRQTGTDLVVDFRNGSVLTASDLTNAELQSIHIAEEGRDQTVDLAKEYADAAGSSAGNAKDSENEARRIAESIKASGRIGYITRRSFEKGFNVTVWNEVLLWEADGNYYRWDGTLPKNVPVGSTPETSGGVGLGSWVSVGDASLRSELSDVGGVNLVKGALHAGLSTDPDMSFNEIIIRGNVYLYDSSVSIASDGLSNVSGSLYLTRNGKSYRLASNSTYVSWPGEYLTGVSDAKSSLEAIMASGRNVDLSGSVVALSTLDMTTDVVNGTLKALGDVGSFINVNSCRLYNTRVDCNNKAVRRAVHIRPGSVKGTAKKVEIFNSAGATNANGVFVDANNAQDFMVDDVFIHNLTSVANGSQGDADGPCRGVIVGTALDPAPTQATVSSGRINNVVVCDLAPFEDCDGVVIQIYNAESTMLSAKNIVLTNIRTSNVRKRAVKIQADDVTVRGVDAYCGTTDTAMYAIVSMYGTNGVAENITGRGRILNGIDCAYGFNHVRGLYLKTERTGDDTLAGIGAGLLINSGQVDARDIYSEGAEYVVAIREALGNTPYVKIDGIQGQGYSGVVRFQIRAGNSIGQVHLSDISATSSATNKGAFSVDFTSGQLSYLNVSDVKRIASAADMPDFNLSGRVTEARFDNCVFNAGSSTVGISMVTGRLVASNISSNKTFAIDANQTTNSYINGVDGMVKLNDTVNTRLILARTPTLVGTNTGLVQASYV